jgi:tRNA G26 N,N-dimethylase Trm1
LSASGLRTIRYLKELEGVNSVYANDLLPAAHKLMNDNFALNNLDPARYKTTLQDANVLLRSHSFDIVDLDPYGSAVPFLDASVGSVKEGGLLCITCTDTRVLCGPDLNKCFYFYGATRAKVHDFNEVQHCLFRTLSVSCWQLSVRLRVATVATLSLLSVCKLIFTLECLCVCSTVKENAERVGQESATSTTASSVETTNTSPSSGWRKTNLCRNDRSAPQSIAQFADILTSWVNLMIIRWTSLARPYQRPRLLP